LQHHLDHVQGQFQPAGFLGIDGKAHIGGPRL
jgi:hypothetical protein